MRADGEHDGDDQLQLLFGHGLHVDGILARLDAVSRASVSSWYRTVGRAERA